MVDATILGPLTWLTVTFGAIGTVVLILLGLFWLWMLIDALMRQRFQEKLVWVLVLIFLNILGAILYYFIEYRRYMGPAGRRR